jgi:hypothetical protein
LIQVIDGRVDRSKLGHDADNAESEEPSSGYDDSAEKTRDSARSRVPVVDGRLDHSGDAGGYEENEQSDAESEQEVVDMVSAARSVERIIYNSDLPRCAVQFRELSKGKDYIPIKTLRNWDELQGLQEAALLTKEILEMYLAELNAPDGKVDFPTFREFVGRLETVMVDEKGSILGQDDDFGTAVDLYDGEYEDTDDEEV